MILYDVWSNVRLHCKCNQWWIILNDTLTVYRPVMHYNIDILFQTQVNSVMRTRGDKNASSPTDQQERILSSCILFIYMLYRHVHITFIFNKMAD
jgi:hypothetical protein